MKEFALLPKHERSKAKDGEDVKSIERVEPDTLSRDRYPAAVLLTCLSCGARQDLDGRLPCDH
ncbi:hypothetical protein [Caballeronia sp. LZ035]|uniref:hypothetical protein n=1 Tax=Caballeronia sp. LZ035 TaxID=3038568 RepID=UPI002858A32C|nr:hypothetical protein [Caballeronia sp. LZ035]MDR5756481.1 hypothetical protein [Caballeronia sp. LZ035]